ncbi:MAG: putative Rossmann fold enzyme [Chlamydiales bacterium]|jgi:uncharacterized Rossmann fold enzyme
MQLEGENEIEWKMGKDQKGQPSLLIGERSIHSLYDAEMQARASVQKILEVLQAKGSNLLILIGLGLGYLPRAFHQEGFSQVVIWDPFPMMRKSLPVHGGEWRKDIPVVGTFQQLYQHILRRAEVGVKPELMIHPGYEPYCQMEFRQAYQSLRTIFGSGVEDNKQNTVISPRSLESIVSIPFYQRLSSLKNICASEEAILVGAGPSLKRCLPYLKERKGGILFAALQALPILQKEGVKVHFVVVADPQGLSGIIEECTPEFNALLAEGAAHPSTLEWCSEKTYLFNIRSDHLHQHIWDRDEDSEVNGPLATVSETQLHLAITLGFRTMLLVGMDFCWTEQRYTHRSPGAPKDDPKELHVREASFRVPTISGEMAETEAMYFHGSRYLNYICSQLSKNNVQFMQYTEGLSIDVAKQIAPEEIQQLFGKGSLSLDLPAKKELDMEVVALAEMLIKEAAESTHQVTQVNSLANRPLNQIVTPFFSEIPVQDRSDICSIFQQKLLDKM